MSFDTIKHKISNIVLDSVKRHLWYLTPELVVLSFFDKDVGSDEKRAEQLLKDFLLLKDLESLMLASLLLTLSKKKWRQRKAWNSVLKLGLNHGSPLRKLRIF